MAGLEAARHTVIARFIGYGPDRIAVEIAPDEVHELAIPMTRAAVILAPLTVTAHRTEEELFSLPVAMSLVSRQTLERRIALTTIAYLVALPEAQVLSGGLMSRRYTTRGSNVGESANVRTMTDFRYTAIPGSMPRSWRTSTTLPSWGPPLRRRSLAC